MGDLESKLKDIAGPKGLFSGADIPEKYFANLSRYAKGAVERPLAVVLPRTTTQVSQILVCCNEAQQPIVPQGGLTGLVGGAFPASDSIALSLERMNEIKEIDPRGRTMTAQAGVILQIAQQRCQEQGLAFPVDLGARGTATLGGMISTNAGGLQVVRYGMMRQSVLGLEAVLADGTIVSSMTGVLKDNAGYDVKQLFIGSEGTLGIVTQAVLRLHPAPKSVNTALLALDRYEDVIVVLNKLQATLRGGLTTFEGLWRNYYEIVHDRCSSIQAPLPLAHDFYVLVEFEGGDPQRDQMFFEETLNHCLAEGLINDAVIAQSEKQRQDIWAVRENADEGLRTLGPLVTFDVSLPIADMEDSVSRMERQIDTEFPGAKTIAMGHLADGNLHILVAANETSNEALRKITDIVYGEISQLGGSISAEHGIGTAKKEYLSITRTDAEIAVMRQLKETLDPNCILNPGKII